MGPYALDEEQSEPLVTDALRGKTLWYRTRRWQIWLGVVITLILAAALIGGTDEGRTSLRSAQAHASDILHGHGTSASSDFSNTDTVTALSTRNHLKHLLIPASSPSPHLCKLLLTATTLSYPNPHLLAWQESFDKPGMLSGGSHIAKVTRTLQYLEGLDTSSDDELALMIDGYDIWFQLPPDVLVNRYYAILSQTEKRLKQRYWQKGWSTAMDQESHDGLSSKIVFGAGKRCAPNQVHTIACYALPASPLPLDLYGEDTDTPIGHNQYYSARQRYLNSGIIMGPVRDMKRLFRRANLSTTREELWLRGAIGPGEPTDNGLGGSDYFYHGSDQSIFPKIWGRQQYVLEVLRRRLDPGWEAGLDTHTSSVIESLLVKDILNPEFPHEHWNNERFQVQGESSLEDTKHPNPWTTDQHELLQKYSFGITVDYFSDLGHQTANSERDTTWLTHQGQQSLSAQIEEHAPRGPFDCQDPWAKGSAATSTSSALSPSNLLVDILNSRHPPTTAADAPSQNTPNPWLQTPLYTHICLARIPVMVHHNGYKGARERDWNRMSWLYDVARPLLSESDLEANELRSPEEVSTSFGRACTDKVECFTCSQLCPNDMLHEEQIFGPHST